MDEMVINSGDTAWMLASTGLVLLMTPGLAFFYGGMVRTKSVLNMIMMSMISMGVVSVLWVIYGFELAFGYEADSPWYGSFSFSSLGGVVNDFTNNGGLYPIPVLVFAAFQLMFAIITPAIISGAIADRAKFTSWAVFVAIWSTLVYFPVAHWVFAFGNKVGDTVTGAGFLASRGVQDFAGGQPSMAALILLNYIVSFATCVFLFLYKDENLLEAMSLTIKIVASLTLVQLINFRLVFLLSGERAILDSMSAVNKQVWSFGGYLLTILALLWILNQEIQTIFEQLFIAIGFLLIIWRIAKGLILGAQLRYKWYYLILYLCTLEILPLIILTKIAWHHFTIVI